MFALVLLICAVSMSSCGMKDAVGRVGLTLEGVRVHGMTDEGFSARLYVRVDNPNWFGARIASVRYTVSVDGADVAVGRTDREVYVPAHGSSVVELPLDVSYGRLKGRLYSLFSGRPDYRVSGEVVFRTWLGRYSLPFNTAKRRKRR